MNIPARITPKDVRNNCQLYVSKIVRDLSADKGNTRSTNTPDDARKAFDDLFKK